MATEVMEKPLQYLDKAMGAIKDLGIWPEQPGEQPITGLLNEITGLDETKVILIGRTLTQASAFNEVVRAQVAAMNIGERYEDITNGFNSIRDDAKGHGRPARRRQARPHGAASQRVDEGHRAATSPAASTRSATPISTSPRRPRTRSTASTPSSKPIATSAAR
ncbi:MAG: hypothetical protein V9G20_30370 [Candidatus Promineifilaceae bacterium]